ncbi:RHS repeat domain-containing protein [Brevundimonas sp. SL130]|uniref:RHS repeat domain-containing protein n=1 Tax=Brevundimonas sp. SL130 TaxID=2995143 RepID=UPI00226CFB8C|nr:RHS repeat domain-containing protein [Brevundimonas sp. SL130]WAC59773.1 RHS repeat protein [Brevundimonas sp. SL130]
MRYVGRGVFVASAMGLSASVLCAGVGQAQVSTTYTYDALGRLKAVTNAGGATVTYSYDAAGNRSQVVVAGAQTAPAAFDLGSPVTGATAGAWILSASPVVSGFTGTAAISVTGGEYRIDGGSWLTAAGTVSAGQSVQVRVQAPATAGASQTATLNIAGVTDTFQVTTAAAADTTPNAYDLGGPVTGAAGAWSSSNTVTIAGIDAATPVSISGGQYRINGGAWTAASGTVTAGQTIQVQVQASTTAGASQTATLNVGGVTDTFQVTTAAADTTPDAYELGSAVVAASGAWSASATVTVAGINAATPVSISGGQYRINGGAWTLSSGTITNGQTIQVQVQAPATGGASQTATLNIGGVTDTFQVTAAVDTTLDAVSWPSISESSQSTNFVTGGAGRTLTGINSNVNIRGTISGLSGNLSAGSRLEMWVNGVMRYHSTNLGNGSWPGGEFAPGENVQFVARAVSADGAQRSGSYTVTVQNLTSGQALGTFTVNQTAGAPDYTPEAFNDFTDQNGVTNDPTIWFGPAQTVTGINQPITLRVERYNYSGNLNEVYVNVYRDSGSGWVHQGSFDPRNSGYQYVDFTVNNGDKIHYAIDGRTYDGRKTGTMNMVVWNLSQPGGAAQLSNRTANITVDNDNNYPIRNVSPVDWDNGHFETNANIGAGATSYRTISGIEAAVTLRADLQNITGQGYNLADGGDFYIESATRGRLASTPWRNGGSVSAVVQPGEQIRFYTDAFTSQGRKQYGFDVQVYNATTGAHIDHHYQSGILDADNNWGYGATVTLSNADMYVFEEVVRAGRPVTASGSVTFTVAGSSGTWTAAVELQNVTGSTPTTSVSGTTAYVRISGSTARYSSGQYRIRITDANGTVSYSPWGAFNLEIAGATGGVEP